MAKKKCYIYKLLAGHDNKPPEVTEFFYAPNAKRLIQYAQQMYKKEKYNKFTPIKVGMSKTDEGTRLISDFEAWYLKQYATAELYSERTEPM
jgi:hypothetical protein